MTIRLKTTPEQARVTTLNKLLFPYILILPVHHDFPCRDSRYVGANHEQPHDEDEDTHDAAHPLDPLTFQLIPYVNDTNSEPSVREDHSPPAVVSSQVPCHRVSERCLRSLPSKRESYLPNPLECTDQGNAEPPETDHPDEDCCK
jgi:hypothetical protein